MLNIDKNKQVNSNEFKLKRFTIDDFEEFFAEKDGIEGIKIKRTFIKMEHLEMALNVMNFLAWIRPEVMNGEVLKYPTEIRFIVRKSVAGKDYKTLESLLFNQYNKDAVIELAKRLRKDEKAGFKCCMYYSLADFDQKKNFKNKNKEMRLEYNDKAIADNELKRKISQASYFINEDVAHSTNIVVFDFDHYTEDAFRKLDELFDKLFLKFTVIRTSKYGKQYILKLSHFVEDKTVLKKLIQYFIEANIEIDTSKTNLSSVFRLPGTFNNKVFDASKNRSEQFITYIERKSDIEYTLAQVHQKLSQLKDLTMTDEQREINKYFNMQAFEEMTESIDESNREVQQRLQLEEEIEVAAERYQELFQNEDESPEDEIEVLTDYDIAVKTDDEIKQEVKDKVKKDNKNEAIKKNGKLYRGLSFYNFSEEYELVKRILCDPCEGIRDSSIMFLMPHFVNTRCFTLDEIKKIFTVYAKLAKLSVTETKQKAERLYKEIFANEAKYKWGKYEQSLKKKFGNFEEFSVEAKYVLDTEVILKSKFLSKLHLLKANAVKMYLKMLLEEKISGKNYFSVEDMKAITGLSDDQNTRSLNELKKNNVGLVSEIYVSLEKDGENKRYKYFTVNKSLVKEKFVPIDRFRLAMIIKDGFLTDLELKFYLYLYKKVYWQTKYGNSTGLGTTRTEIIKELGSESEDYLSVCTEKLVKKGLIRKEVKRDGIKKLVTYYLI